MRKIYWVMRSYNHERAVMVCPHRTERGAEGYIKRIFNMSSLTRQFAFTISVEYVADEQFRKTMEKWKA